jgi:tetratricopeptide (TPR) repeat protein
MYFPFCHDLLASRRRAVGGVAVLVACFVLCGPAAAQDPSDERLDEAIRELTYFNFSVAYDIFAELRDDLADASPSRQRKVTMGLALAAQNKTPATEAALAEAQSLYEQLVREAPESEFAARALIQLGRIAEVRDFGGDEIDLPTARGYYERVFNTWLDEPIADEAALRYADTYFQQFDDLEAVAEGERFLTAWIERREDSALASAMWEVLATVRQDLLDDPEGALEAFTKVDQLGLTDPNSAGALYYRFGRLAEDRVGDIDTAVRFYQKSITEGPRSGRAYHAQLALESLQERMPDRTIEVPQIQVFMQDDEADTSDQESLR